MSDLFGPDSSAFGAGDETPGGRVEDPFESDELPPPPADVALSPPWRTEDRGGDTTSNGLAAGHFSPSAAGLTGLLTVRPALGRFEVQCEIGRGGMGVILKGHDAAFGRHIAIKVASDAHRGDLELQRRFLAEARITGQLQHPGIVSVHEMGRLPDGRPYFIMKLVQGQTLSDRLRGRTDPTQDLPSLLNIFEQVCQTMAYAHAGGVIHRDLKPSNIMVGDFGEVQVMDWGLAKKLPGSRADGAGEGTTTGPPRMAAPASDQGTQDGKVLGTPAYMAPEQARGQVEQVDERSDPTFRTSRPCFL